MDLKTKLALMRAAREVAKTGLAAAATQKKQNKCGECPSLQRRSPLGGYQVTISNGK